MLNLVSAGYKCFHDKNELQFINSIGHKRFNISLFVHNALILNDFRDWNIYILCFIFAFNVSFLRYNAERTKHHARKSKPQCKKIKNTVQEISEHNARDAEWRDEMKSETLCFKFHSLKLLIINRLYLVSETWKMKSHWP